LEWFRASLLLLTIALGLVTGFYLLTARFWRVAAGRRLAGLLASFTALAVYVFIARAFPDGIRYWIGTGLVLLLTAAVVRMGVTMVADWRAAGRLATTTAPKEPAQ
jgi:hypothetical protein